MSNEKTKVYLAHRIIRKMCLGGVYTAESELARSVENSMASLPKKTLFDIAIIFDVRIPVKEL